MTNAPSAPSSLGEHDYSLPWQECPHCRAERPELWAFLEEQGE